VTTFNKTRRRSTTSRDTVLVETPSKSHASGRKPRQVTGAERGSPAPNRGGASEFVLTVSWVVFGIFTGATPNGVDQSNAAGADSRHRLTSSKRLSVRDHAARTARRCWCDRSVTSVPAIAAAGIGRLLRRSMQRKGRPERAFGASPLEQLTSVRAGLRRRSSKRCPCARTGVGPCNSERIDMWSDAR